MSASVFHGNTVKPVEPEAGMPGVEEKKVQTTCCVMEEIKQLKSVVPNAMHVTLHRRMCGLVVIFTSKVQEWYHKRAVTLKTSSMNRSWVVEHLRGAFM